LCVCIARWRAGSAVTADGGGLGGQPGNIGPGQPGTASPGTASPGTTPPPTAPTWDGVRGQPVRTVRHSEAVRGRQWTADARGPPGAVRTAGTAGTAGTALARACAREMLNPRPPKSAPRPSRARARVICLTHDHPNPPQSPRARARAMRANNSTAARTVGTLELSAAGKGQPGTSPDRQRLPTERVDRFTD
jgi:hypothetical protein